MKLSTAILSVCLAAATILSVEAANQKYGSACTAQDKCDARFGTIACSPSENVCRCVDEESMVYNAQQDTCLSKQGAMCYSRPLKNLHVRKCVAGSECVAVSPLSVFGTCQEVTEEEDDDNVDINELVKVKAVPLKMNPELVNYEVKEKISDVDNGIFESTPEDDSPGETTPDGAMTVAASTLLMVIAHIVLKAF